MPMRAIDIHYAIQDAIHSGSEDLGKLFMRLLDQGEKEIIRYFSKVVDGQTNTPIHIIFQCVQGNTDKIRKLITWIREAQVNKFTLRDQLSRRNYEGETPVHLAIDAILKHARETGMSAQQIIASEEFQLINALVSDPESFDLESRCPNGDQGTILHFLVKKLSAYGVDSDNSALLLDAFAKSSDRKAHALAVENIDGKTVKAVLPKPLLIKAQTLGVFSPPRETPYKKGLSVTRIEYVLRDAFHQGDDAVIKTVFDLIARDEKEIIHHLFSPKDHGMNSIFHLILKNSKGNTEKIKKLVEWMRASDPSQDLLRYVLSSKNLRGETPIHTAIDQLLRSAKENGESAMAVIKSPEFALINELASNSDIFDLEEISTEDGNILHYILAKLQAYKTPPIRDPAIFLNAFAKTSSRKIPALYAQNKSGNTVGTLLPEGAFAQAEERGFFSTKNVLHKEPRRSSMEVEYALRDVESSGPSEVLDVFMGFVRGDNKNTIGYLSKKVDKYRNTVFHWMCKDFSKNIGEIQTILQWASVDSEKKEAVRIALSKMNTHGESPLYFAVDSIFLEAKKGNKKPRDIMESAEFKFLVDIASDLELFNLEERGPKGNTILHHLVKRLREYPMGPEDSTMMLDIFTKNCERRLIALSALNKNQKTPIESIWHMEDGGDISASPALFPHQGRATPSKEQMLRRIAHASQNEPAVLKRTLVGMVEGNEVQIMHCLSQWVNNDRDNVLHILFKAAQDDWGLVDKLAKLAEDPGVSELFSKAMVTANAHRVAPIHAWIDAIFMDAKSKNKTFEEVVSSKEFLLLSKLAESMDMAIAYDENGTILHYLVHKAIDSEIEGMDPMAMLNVFTNKNKVKADALSVADSNGKYPQELALEFVREKKEVQDVARLLSSVKEKFADLPAGCFDEGFVSSLCQQGVRLSKILSYKLDDSGNTVMHVLCRSAVSNSKVAAMLSMWVKGDACDHSLLSAALSIENASRKTPVRDAVECLANSDPLEQEAVDFMTALLGENSALFSQEDGDSNNILHWIMGNAKHPEQLYYIGQGSDEWDSASITINSVGDTPSMLLDAYLAKKKVPVSVTPVLDAAASAIPLITTPPSISRAASSERVSSAAFSEGSGSQDLDDKAAPVEQTITRSRTASLGSGETILPVNSPESIPPLGNQNRSFWRILGAPFVWIWSGVVSVARAVKNFFYPAEESSQIAEAVRRQLSQDLQREQPSFSEDAPDDMLENENGSVSSFCFTLNDCDYPSGNRLEEVHPIAATHKESCLGAVNPSSQRRQ